MKEGGEARPTGVNHRQAPGETSPPATPTKVAPKKHHQDNAQPARRDSGLHRGLNFTSLRVRRGTI